MQIKTPAKEKINNSQSNHYQLNNEKKVDINILLNRIKIEEKNIIKKTLLLFWCCRLSINYRFDYCPLKQFKVYLASISVVKFFFVKSKRFFFISKTSPFSWINFSKLFFL